MYRPERPLSGVATAVSLLLVGAVASCGGGGQAPPDTNPLPDVTSPVVEEPADTASSDTVPADRGARRPGPARVDTVRPGESYGDTLPEALTEKQFDLNVPGESLKPVLRLLSHRSGVNFVIDPAVQGTVSVDLTNVNTVDALDYVLTPLGYGFRYERGAVWIKQRVFRTRVFNLNYAITGREGQKSLTVGAGSLGGGGLGSGGGVGGVTGGTLQGGQGARGGAGATGQLGGVRGGGGRLGGRGLGGGGQFGAGTSTVTSGSSANVYQDLQNGLQAIIFGSVEDDRQRNGQGGGAGGLNRGTQLTSIDDSRAFSRTDSVGRQLIVNPFAGLVQITAEPGKLNQAANYLERVQGSVKRQVLIEAEIVEVALGEQDRFGIDWSAVLDEVSGAQSLLGPSQNQSFEVQVTDEDVDAVLRALSQQNELRTLASPRVSTLNNQKTVLQATTQEVFFSSVVSQPVVSDGTVVPSERQFVPQVVPVGVVVDVTPQISRTGQIIMDIRPSVSEIQGVAESPEGDTQPILDVRTIDTMARVESGQTIVIGGLIQQRDERQKSGVPFLSDVPVVGGLFSNVSDENERSQLVIFLTPHVQKGRRIDELTESQRRQLQRMSGQMGHGGRR